MACSMLQIAVMEFIFHRPQPKGFGCGGVRRGEFLRSEGIGKNREIWRWGDVGEKWRVGEAKMADAQTRRKEDREREAGEEIGRRGDGEKLRGIGNGAFWRKTHVFEAVTEFLRDGTEWFCAVARPFCAGTERFRAFAGSSCIGTESSCAVAAPFCIGTELFCVVARLFCAWTAPICTVTKQSCAVAAPFWIGTELFCTVASSSCARTEPFCTVAGSFWPGTEWFCAIAKPFCTGGKSRCSRAVLEGPAGAPHRAGTNFHRRAA